MGNSFGRLFCVSSWGESHGAEVGVVVDGCPSRLALSEGDIQGQLDRRRPGQSAITTQRQESDRVRIVSGLFDGKTLGTPIALRVENHDARPRDYQALERFYRPSHADFTYDAKYHVRAPWGGGRASARETVARVAAGAIARKLLRERWGVEILGWVRRIYTLDAEIDASSVRLEDVEANPVRCPDSDVAELMEEAIRRARKEGDSLGGVVEVVARGVPPGWGAPVFDKLDADLAKAMVSIPACKGVEIGSGFAGVAMTGSKHNDAFYQDGESIRTRSNHSGGIQGGISNGETVRVRAAFKPTATIASPQETVTATGEAAELRGHGRHDPCVVPRAVPIVEAMMALVLVDHALRQRGQNGSSSIEI